MDRKVWGSIIEEAMQRYFDVTEGKRLTSAYEPWRADAPVSEHVLEFAQQLADVGRERLG